MAVAVDIPDWLDDGKACLSQAAVRRPIHSDVPQLDWPGRANQKSPPSRCGAQ